MASDHVATRPIWIDKRAVASLVSNQLVPEIEHWLKHHPNQDEPIGAVKLIASGNITIDAADGRSPVDVKVEVGSVESKGKYAAVLSGASNGSGVWLDLNGALSPHEFFGDAETARDPLHYVPNRMQPLHSCTHETCVPFGLYSILIHELTHAAESIFKQKLRYSPTTVREQGEAAWGPYVNDPQEVRAFMQEITDSAVRDAGRDALRGVAESSPQPNQRLLDLVLKMSTTWKLIEKHLSSHNRALILKAVYDRLDQAKLLFDEPMIMHSANKIAARFIKQARFDAASQKGCQHCGSEKGYDRTYGRCTSCGEPYSEGSTGGHFRTGEPPGPEFMARFTDRQSMAIRVAATYKNKKKIKTQDGEDMTVYEYSDRQIANRNKKKAERIEKLRKGIEKLRSKVKKDLHSQDPEKTLTALAVALMDHTYERVGNDESAKDGHFGVTGWCKKHVSFGKGGVTIKYVGKSGVKHEKKVTDAGVKAALRSAYDAVDGDNDEILSWDGGRVTPEKVNEYLSQFDITAKDLRGFHANREMQERLKAARKAGGKLPEDKKKRAKQLKDEFKEALEGAADAVGHEPSTLRSQYLVPGLEETFLEDGSVSDKLGTMDVVAKPIVLDLAWIESLRKDFLTLLKNLPRVHDYKTAHTLRNAIRVYRNHFDEVFFARFLNHDLKYEQGLSEGDAKWYDKELRGIAWSFSTELSLPIGFADEYRSEETLFAKFEQEFPAWKVRIQRKAQVFWKAMRTFVEYISRHRDTPGFSVNMPDVDTTEIEGFKLIMLGFKPGDEYDEKYLAMLKAGLHMYRQRASRVAPILLKRQLPVNVQFEVTLDKGGEYHHDGTITFYASSLGSKTGVDWVVHVMAHEMGHHLWHSMLSEDAKRFWTETIRGDLGDLDIQELLAKWPDGTWAYEMPEVLGRTDPILALQIQALSHDPTALKELQKKEEFQKLLDSGVKTVQVPKTPITGYANKSPEEAFCETIGLLVAHGPMAIHERVRFWLETTMPGEIKVARALAAYFSYAPANP